MELEIFIGWLRKMKLPYPWITDAIEWRSDHQKLRIDISKLKESEVDLLYKTAGEEKGPGHRVIKRAIDAFRAVNRNPSGTRITNLRALPGALKAFIANTCEHRWLFCTENDGVTLPYYVTNIYYTEGRWTGGGRSGYPRVYHPPYVTLELTCASGDRCSITFKESDLNSTIPQMLLEEKWYIETPELHAAYLTDLKHYKKWSSKLGKQFLAIGTGTGMKQKKNRYGEWEETNTLWPLERDGEPARVVMDNAADDEEGEEESDETKHPMHSYEFWEGTRPIQIRKLDEDGEEVEPTDDSVDAEPEVFDKEGKLQVALPIHAYVRVFDLEHHAYVRVHVSNLTAYKYDTKLVDKLVVPDTTKNLVTALVGTDDKMGEDIVKGKSGGTIIISTGPPGVGKTLTAEVMAESLKRPLYVVQCSQLGVDATAVEANLVNVLKKAARWKALLLIDEADVYIRERGLDIEQNAIVGVWLRILEKYKGILVMTSNRGTIIDDAVMSRATAWIRYEKPDKKQLRDIWRVLSEQYGVELSKEERAELVKLLPNLTGRNVKNLLKLGSKIGPKLKQRGVALFQYAAQFLDLEDKG